MEVLRNRLLHCGRAARLAARRWASACTSTGAGAGGSLPAQDKSEKNGPHSEKGGSWERRVVSGLQPTGALHLGNYFGALRRCVRAQDSGDDLALFIADLHSLTTRHEPEALRADSLELTALALAAGVDPDRSMLYLQSAVPRHAELCWLLACLCTQARVHHMPQYREKAAGAGAGGEVPLGLLLYPVLQAADVLLLRGTHVPVGADQQPHLQLAALLARTFRHRYGPAFPEPRAWLPEDGSDRILSLRAPDRKMSKSDRDSRAAVLLTDADDAIRNKVRRAVTDCEPHVSYEPTRRPGVSNLVRLHCLAAGLLPEEAVEESAALTTAMYKSVVADALCAVVGPIRARAAELRARPRLLRDVLRVGAARARRRADRTYEAVARLAGLASPYAATPPHHVLRLQPAAPAPAPAPEPAEPAAPDQQRRAQRS